jgi:hypothetical protein
MSWTISLQFIKVIFMPTGISQEMDYASAKPQDMVKKRSDKGKSRLYVDT